MTIKRLLLTLMILSTVILLIDWKLFMLDRVNRHSWESRGGTDYLIVGKDQLGKGDFEVNEDTLTMTSGNEKGKKLLVRYCILSNLWLTTLKKDSVAWYISP